jgi:hypothetical protein
MQLNPRAPLVALVCIFLLGFLVLIYRLDHTPLWADEGWTIAATDELNPVITVRDWVAIDVHPPLFFLELNVWRAFTGDTIFELRYFSLLLTMIGVAVAYRLGRSAYSTRAGLLAALFYALHDLIKVLTQEVRHYPQQMLLSTLTLWMYWRFWKQPTRSRGVAFVLSGAALIYTHYWGGFVLIGLLIHVAATRRDRLRPYALAFAAIALLFLPWLPVLISQITMERPGGLPHALDNHWFVYAVLIYQLVGVPELLWVILAVCGLIGAFALVPRRWWPQPANWFPLPAILLAPAVSIALNTVYPILSFRSLAVIVPALIVMAAHGLSRFRQPEQTAIVGFILLYSLSKTSADALPRFPWPEVAAYLRDHSTASDVILLELDSDSDPMTYYLDQAGAAALSVHSERIREREPEIYGAFLDEALNGRAGVWVAQLDWEADKDIRPDLSARGLVQTAPPISYSEAGFVANTPYVYSDGRPLWLWRLDRPAEDEPLVIYGDLMTLARAEATAVEGTVVVNLLWRPSAAPQQDYVVSVFVRGADGTFRNADSLPLNGLSSTLGWQPGNLYFDSRAVDLAGFAPGAVEVGVSVYYFTDSTYTTFENLPASDCSHDSECRFVIVDTFALE